MADDVRLGTEPLHAEELLATFRAGPDGAQVLFSGITRDHFEGRRVRFLEYEAYLPMAEAKLREVLDEARRRFGLGAAAVRHRIGRVPIGETSLLVAVSAPHRAAALEAAGFVVDRIKECVPIWKREHFDDSSSAWVEGKLKP